MRVASPLLACLPVANLLVAGLLVASLLAAGLPVFSCEIDVDDLFFLGGVIGPELIREHAFIDEPQRKPVLCIPSNHLAKRFSIFLIRLGW